MPRALILIPHSRDAIVGGTPIDPGYPRSYTPDDMRSWADGLERHYRDAETGRPDPTADAQRHFLSDPAAGIKGSLRPDGRVELSGGRHRAHYLLERGVDPVPVWVSGRDMGELARFRAECHDSVERSRPGLLQPERVRVDRDDAPPDRGDTRGERER